MWTLLAATLQLGNLDFARSPSEHEGDGCQPCDHQAVDLVARLLEVQPTLLASSLTRRRLSVRNQNVIMRTQSLQQVRRHTSSGVIRCHQVSSGVI